MDWNGESLSAMCFHINNNVILDWLLKAENEALRSTNKQICFSLTCSNQELAVALAHNLAWLNTVLSAHGGEKLARLGELAINTRENKRAIDCCSVGVAPSVKTTEILPSGFFIFASDTFAVYSPALFSCARLINQRHKLWHFDSENTDKGMHVERFHSPKKCALNKTES